LYLCVAVLITISCKEEASAPVNTAPIPRILALEPTNALARDTLSIVGINFSKEASENEVKFGQSVIETVSVSDTLIQVIVPEIEGDIVGVSVRSRGKISNKQNLSLLRKKAFTDNFDRADVPLVGVGTVPNPLGANGQVITGKFWLSEDQVFSSEGALQSYMLYRDPELDMKVGNGHYFDFSVSMSSSAGSYIGVIFNAQ